MAVEIPEQEAPVAISTDEPAVEEAVDLEETADFVEEEPDPSAEEMAAYLGAAEGLGSDGNSGESVDKELPSLEEAEARIPAKAKALMEELFRARVDKVKRIDPKLIR